jgi:hypothetical protein
LRSPDVDEKARIHGAPSRTTFAIVRSLFPIGS